MYAGVAQRIHDETGGRVNFAVSLKGGGNCQLWAGEWVVVVQLLYGDVDHDEYIRHM